MRKGEPTPDEMYQAVVDAGEALREPGDNQSTIRHRIAREAGLSERTVRAYFHREARRNHAAHLALFEDLIARKAVQDAPSSIQKLIQKLQRDILEAHERIHRLEHSARREIAERDGGSPRVPGTFHSPVA